MMDYRENAGYIITDSCHVGDSEFVLGVHLTAPQQFVTWKCRICVGRSFDSAPAVCHLEMQ